MSADRQRLFAAAFALASLLSGCIPLLSPERSRLRPEAGDEDYPGELQDPSSIAQDFVWQQEVTSDYQGRTTSGVVVVQKEGPRLTTVGLTPFGTRAFVLEQNGSRLTFTKFVAVDLKISPRVMLVDINRAFLIGARSAARPDGVHTYRRDGEIVKETWKKGRIVQRSFERPGGPKGLIVVRYGEGMRGIEPPPEVVLENGWYGYKLKIRTLSASPLTPAAP